MWRIKIFGKFIVWLLKKVLWAPLTIVAYMHIFLHEWKKNCREEVGLALFMYLLTILGTLCGGAIGILVLYDEPVLKPLLQSSILTSFYLATGLFAFVILLASYDKFIEEYEQSFTKLKE